MPHGRRMTGVVLGPRVADPTIRGDTWAEWARGPNGEIVKGEADSDEQVVADLANQLGKVRSDPNG